MSKGKWNPFNASQQLLPPTTNWHIATMTPSLRLISLFFLITSQPEEDKAFFFLLFLYLYNLEARECCQLITLFFLITSQSEDSSAFFFLLFLHLYNLEAKEHYQKWVEAETYARIIFAVERYYKEQNRSSNRARDLHCKQLHEQDGLPPGKKRKSRLRPDRGAKCVQEDYLNENAIFNQKSLLGCLA